jgi:hypothetical protein
MRSTIIVATAIPAVAILTRTDAPLGIKLAACVGMIIIAACELVYDDDDSANH